MTFGAIACLISRFIRHVNLNSSCILEGETKRDCFAIRRRYTSCHANPLILRRFAVSADAIVQLLRAFVIAQGITIANPAFARRRRSESRDEQVPSETDGTLPARRWSLRQISRTLNHCGRVRDVHFPRRRTPFCVRNVVATGPRANSLEPTLSGPARSMHRLTPIASCD